MRARTLAVDGLVGEEQSSNNPSAIVSSLLSLDWPSQVGTDRHDALTFPSAAPLQCLLYGCFPASEGVPVRRSDTKMRAHRAPGGNASYHVSAASIGLPVWPHNNRSTSERITLARGIL